MAAGRDDAVVTDAFFSASLGGGPESTIPAGSAFFVNVDVEAGSSAMLNGDAYTLKVLLQNVTNFTNDVIATFKGNLGNPPNPGTFTGTPNLAGTTLLTPPSWSVANTDVTFSLSVPAPGAPTGTIYRILAIVTLGTAQGNVETYESELILVI
jgi:hypothetical protein